MKRLQSFAVCLQKVQSTTSEKMYVFQMSIFELFSEYHSKFAVSTGQQIRERNVLKKFVLIILYCIKSIMMDEANSEGCSN